VTVEKRTLVLYEAPHRLLRTLDDLADAGLAGRLVSLGRELTKRHEEVLRLPLDEARRYFAGHEPRGEFVLVIEGREAYGRRCPKAAGEPRDGAPLPGEAMPPGAAQPDSADMPDSQVLRLLASLLRQGLSVREAARRCGETTGRKRNELYRMALALRQDAAAAKPGGLA